MISVQDVCERLEALAPLELAESWDNVGLLVGRSNSPVRKIMTALTLVPENVDEAIAGSADLVVVHHPLPFHSLKRITSDTPVGKMLLDLIGAGIAVYSLHTAWDNTSMGINEQLASILQLENVRPLIASKQPELAHRNLGSGRVGVLARPTHLQDLAQRLQNALGIDATQGRDKIKGVVVNSLARKVGIVCGSGGSLLPYARDLQCDLFITGEATFHQCLEAQAHGISLLLLGHFASEKFALDHLGNLLAQNFSGLEVWSSKNENEPVVPLGY